MVRIGIPSFTYHPGIEDEPFWRLRERLAVDHQAYLTRREWASAELFKVIAAQQIVAKGEVNSEFTDFLSGRADRALVELGKILAPWQDWSEEAEKASREGALRASVPALIEAWYRYFEPENLQEYLDSQKQEDPDSAGQ